MAQETYTNRLAQEKSPYLLQHAHNPVDWYPWGEEAFHKAKAENKPIFLSIGYSTCHWCHVMEEESFVNPEIAKILNDHFVSIKVDREERPDVDHLYMQAVMAMTGAGGWPMSVFLTPDQKPFYGGTYFPPTDKWGKPGFSTLLKTIHEKWISEHDRLLKSGEDIAQMLQEEAQRKTQSKHIALNKGTLKVAYEQFASRFDSNTGGFSDAPKFPQSHILSFLLRYWKRTGQFAPRGANWEGFEIGADRDQPLQMVTKTLEEMAKGGMYDQLGGGFHRYSTDSQWRVPHFEKMLYDQAILAKSYLEAYQVTRKEQYAQVAREIFDYVLRDMTNPKGGFYSAEDADSAADPAVPNKKTEGAFYVWSYDEILKHLSKEQAEIFNFYFGVLPEGNAAQDPHEEFKRKNILYVDHSLEETAAAFKKSPEEIRQMIQEAKEKLNAVRLTRQRPHLDDKVLTDWNGLMISALALGSRVLGEPRYGVAAKRAADFILENMIIPSPQPSPLRGEGRVGGRLMHRYRDGHVSVLGFLEDYAFFTHGLIDLYEATFDSRYLEETKLLLNQMHALFWDDATGGFFLTGTDAESLIIRVKDVYDGALPSGNSVAALSLLRAARLMMNQEFEQWAQKTLEAFSESLSQYPSGFAQMMIALDFALGPSREIVIAGPAKILGEVRRVSPLSSGKEGNPEIEQILKQIFSRFIPNKVVKFQASENRKTTVNFCQNHVCQLPLTDLSKLEGILDADVR